jgi:hypothetical protein
MGSSEGSDVENLARNDPPISDPRHDNSFTYLLHHASLGLDTSLPSTSSTSTLTFGGDHHEVVASLQENLLGDPRTIRDAELGPEAGCDSTNPLFSTTGGPENSPGQSYLTSFSDSDLWQLRRDTHNQVAVSGDIVDISGGKANSSRPSSPQKSQCLRYEADVYELHDVVSSNTSERGQCSRPSSESGLMDDAAQVSSWNSLMAQGYVTKFVLQSEEYMAGYQHELQLDLSTRFGIQMIPGTNLYESNLFGCLVGEFTTGVFAFMESGEYARLVSENTETATKLLGTEGSEVDWEGQWRESGEIYDKFAEGVELT